MAAYHPPPEGDVADARRQLAAEARKHAPTTKEMTNEDRVAAYQKQSEYFDHVEQQARQEKFRIESKRQNATSDDERQSLDAEYAAAQKLEEAARIKPVGGQLPKNHAYAGKEYGYDDIRKNNPGDLAGVETAIADLEARGLTGIKFGADGYPELEPVVYREGGVAADLNIDLTGNRNADFKAADAAMRVKLGDPDWERPRGFTWHHHQEVGRMVLVPTKIHGVIDHTGGVAGHRAETGDLNAYRGNPKERHVEGETADELEPDD